MGGAVNVVVREKNGRVHKMCRWTNNICSYLYSSEIATNPDKLLKEYIKARHKSDYDSLDTTFSPDGYGLIVIDNMTKTIMSHQDYTSFDETTGAKYNLDFRLRETLDFKLKDSPIPFINLNKFKKSLAEINRVFGQVMGQDFSREESELKYLKQQYDFFMSGAVYGDREYFERFKGMATRSEKKELKVYEEFLARFSKPEPRSIEDWKFFLEKLTTKDGLFLLKVKLGDFKIIDFRSSDNSTYKQYMKFKDKLTELGFTFTKQDNKDWDNYLEDYKLEDEEDN